MKPAGSNRESIRGGGPSGQLFVEVGDLVALLQAKARRYLAEHPAA
jgi:hypothetical protein